MWKFWIFNGFSQSFKEKLSVKFGVIKKNKICKILIQILFSILVASHAEIPPPIARRFAPFAVHCAPFRRPISAESTSAKERRHNDGSSRPPTAPTPHPARF